MDDQPTSREVLRVRLESWGYSVTTAESGAEALEILAQPGAPRMVILDWMMPAMSGVEVCRRIREKADTEYTYVLMLTCKSERQDVCEGLEAGADDYLVKPFHTHELQLRVRAGMRIVELQSQLRAMAHHDPLTGIWNRRRIMQFLEGILDELIPRGETVAVVLFDLDHFKRINDSSGHAAGDAVLRTICRRIPDNLRPYDGFGRIGGEEFMVVLPACDWVSAVHVAERLRRVVASEPVRAPAREIHVTASFGVAMCTPQMNADDVVAAADELLYRAKVQGRNRVEVCDNPSATSGARPAVG